MTHIILGSSSPRRREILEFFSLPFIQVASDFNEESILFSGSPQEYAKNLSEAKALTLAKKYPHDLILTADTVVYCNGKIYNKPKSTDEAFLFLSELSGQWHHVFTSVTVQKQTLVFTEVEDTKILFHPLSSDQIRAYHKHNHCLDKAGAYAIQKGGSIIISKIDGCYYNVMGLPLNALKNTLSLAGINLWSHL